MKTNYYLRREAQINAVLLPGGTLIATLETPDGVDVNRVINALAHGLATTTPPANKATVQGQAIPVGDKVAAIDSTKPPAPHPAVLQVPAAATVIPASDPDPATAKLTNAPAK